MAVKCVCESVNALTGPGVSATALFLDWNNGNDIIKTLMQSDKSCRSFCPINKKINGLPPTPSSVINAKYNKCSTCSLNVSNKLLLYRLLTRKLSAPISLKCVS